MLAVQRQQLASQPNFDVNNAGGFTSRDLLQFSDPPLQEDQIYSATKFEGKAININDFLQPITDTRVIKRMKFDPESPKFTEACKRLAIDMKDIERKKLSEFEAQIRNERPEEDQNPVLIRELATIRYNYYLTTFKEIFNDVLEERRHIVHEEINQFHNQRSKLVS